MANFTVRIELHNALAEDYDTLHDEMSQQGFLTTITSVRQITYHLPKAEYNISGNYTRREILNKAQLAINVTQRNSSILVTKSMGRSWRRLNIEE